MKDYTEAKKRAREMRAKGLSYAMIADELGHAKSTIDRWVKDTDLPPVSERPRAKDKRERQRRARGLADQGLDVGTIAMRVCVSPATVQRYLSGTKYPSKQRESIGSKARVHVCINRPHDDRMGVRGFEHHTQVQGWGYSGESVDG